MRYAALLCGSLFSQVKDLIRLIPPSLNTEAWFVVAGMLIAFLRALRGGSRQGSVSRANWLDIVAAVALTLTILGFFGWTAHSYFLSDDFILLGQAHVPLSWHGALATRGGDGSFRPAGYVSYAISAKWAGSDPSAWHWIGYWMHAANTVLLYALAAVLGYSRFAAWLAATLFAVHGAHPEAVIWIAGRFDLLSTFFFLWATLTFVCSWRATGGRRIVWLAVAVVSMLTALLSKESAYSFPLVALLLMAYSAEARNRGVLGAIVLFFALAGMAFVYRWHLLGGIGGYGGVSLLSSLKALAFRMWAILFFPVNWSIQPAQWIAILTLVYMAVLARLFFARAELRRLVFAVGFVILTAAPAVSQLLIGPDLEKARVLYLPSIGICLLLAALCEPLRFRDRTILATALIVFHGAALWHNLQGWQKASEVVQSACAIAAKCTRSPGQRILVTGLPRTLDGVYTFANGFKECVVMQGGMAPGEVEVRRGASVDKDGVDDCQFAWDTGTNTLRAVR